MKLDPHIRPATLEDTAEVFTLASQLATSFRPERDAFEQSARALLGQAGACWLVAETDGRLGGYCLGFVHPAFYANGSVAWVEEIMVAAELRGRGVGRALMANFEGWAHARGARLVALATRRAAAFYQALGYEESASYLRKLLG